jgi:hypothetical protein
MGADLFQKVYEFLKFNRRKGTDEALIHSKIKDMVGGNKAMMSQCFELDVIVFMEIQRE